MHKQEDIPGYFRWASRNCYRSVISGIHILFMHFKHKQLQQDYMQKHYWVISCLLVVQRKKINFWGLNSDQWEGKWTGKDWPGCWPLSQFICKDKENFGKVFCHSWDSNPVHSEDITRSVTVMPSFKWNTSKRQDNTVHPSTLLYRTLKIINRTSWAFKIWHCESEANR
jgi:hypothetical protein